MGYMDPTRTNRILQLFIECTALLTWRMFDTGRLLSSRITALNRPTWTDSSCLVGYNSISHGNWLPSALLTPQSTASVAIRCRPQIDSPLRLTVFLGKFVNYNACIPLDPECWRQSRWSHPEIDYSSAILRWSPNTMHHCAGINQVGMDRNKLTAHTDD